MQEQFIDEFSCNERQIDDQRLRRKTKVNYEKYQVPHDRVNVTLKRETMPKSNIFYLNWNKGKIDSEYNQYQPNFKPQDLSKDINKDVKE